MQIKLHNLKIENFKGISSFEFSPDSSNAVIVAANGVGKTTIYDAFLWLLFGKDSAFREDFEVRPLDDKNKMITGLVVKVEGTLSIDGNLRTFRKEQHEKVIKKTGQITGYETSCWIDEVPTKVGSYQAHLKDIIDDSVFKLLTDSHYFNDKMHWKERRSALLAIAGKIGTPKGFAELLKQANGRSISDFRKVLLEQKKRHEEERDDIGPALNENHKTLETIGGGEVDTSALEAKREELRKQLEANVALREGVYSSEQKRNETIEQIQRLEVQLAKRQATLETDMSNVAALIEEKTLLHNAVNEHFNEVVRSEKMAQRKKIDLENHQRIYAGHLESLESIRQEHQKTVEAKADTVCHTCGQALPANKITEVAESKKKQLEELRKKGVRIKKEAVEEKVIVDMLQTEYNALKMTYSNTISEQKQLEEKTGERITEIDNAITNREKPNPAEDFECKKVTGLIEKAKAELGPSAADRIKAVDSKRSELQAAIEQINKALNNVDTASKLRGRVEELENKQKTLSQQIADIDKQLASIGEYTAAESQLIEDTVNGKFKYVNFKMFEQALNGNIEETCIATLNGVPYGDMSYGQKILVGIDIIKVLSKHYGISIVLFVDNAESLSYPIEAVSQVIQLKMNPKVKALKVEVEQTEKMVA